MPETIDLNIIGINNEEDARVLDKSLAKVPDLKTHKVEFSNQRALIASESREAIQAAISQIKNLGYQVKSEQVQLPVEGMSCAACASSVESVLGRQAGILEANVNFANASVQLHYLPNITSPVVFRKSLQKIGFDLRLEEETPRLEADKEEEARQQLRQLRNKTILAAIFTLPLMLLGMVFTDVPYANYLMLISASVVLFGFGKQFFVNALRQARHGYANMDSLVALSTGVAYLFSLVNTFYPQYLTSRGLEAHVYYEAAAVIITFILLGRWLEGRAKSQTSQALRQLMGMQAKRVFRLREDGQIEEVNLEAIQVNDHIRVKSGEKIPLDGEVIEGSSLVDESLISGEPLPLEKEVGSKVFAGTINQQGSFVFRAERVGKSTLLAQIIERVKQAQGSKAKVQKLADRIAGIFVPTVIGIALLSFSIWLLFGGENAFTQAILALVTVLVIACPCALGLATPTAIMVGVGKAAKQGILVKDAESLEVAPQINTLILDKTGTITQGKPSLENIHWVEENNTHKAILYQMEQQASHPLGEAIVQHLAKENFKHITLSSFETIGGKGLKATHNAQTYWVGNQGLMANEGVEMDSATRQKAEKWQSEGATMVYFAQNQSLKALIALKDQPKPSSASAIRDLQKQGIEVHMLTGDNRVSAQKIAQSVNISHYRAEMLPQDKEDYIKALQAQGKKVAMVGDGINDSPALARADMSIAMGKGADIAMEVAKMTIISSDLAKIPQALQLSTQTLRVIRQNLFWAFFYNIVGIPIAAGLLYPFTGFLLNPMIAGAAMAFSSVSVVSNSLRLRYLS